MTQEERDEARKAHKLREENASKTRDADLVEVLQTSTGRRFVARVVYELGGLKALGFNVDPHLRDFQQGQRAVGVALEKEVRRVDVALWARMENERTEQLRAEPVAIASVREDDEADEG